MAVAGRTKKLCRNCRHVGSEQKIEIGSFVCNLSWCNLDECYVRQDNSCNDYGQKIKDEPVHCANCTFMSIDEDWCCFNKSVLLVSNSGVCTCENAKPRITMEHCKKCGWHYTGYMGCNGINGKIECPISKGARRDAIRIEDPCKKKANELMDVLTEIAQEPNAYKVLTDKNHWQRCENCKHYKCLCCYNPDGIYGRFVAKHGLCSKFELASGKKKKPSCLDCLYYKDTVLCSIANHFEICSDFLNMRK